MTKKTKAASQCECERDCHFGPDPVHHLYGAKVAALFDVKTPFGTMHVCGACKDTCLAIYVVPQQEKKK